MAPAVPVLGFFDVDQAKVGLVDQGGRLQRLVGRLLSHAGRRQFPQLVIHERQQLRGCRRIALFDD